MAFVDAIELASEAGAADAISATAGDLATVAPAIENTFAGATASLRHVASTAKADITSATLPVAFDPFPGNTLATVAVIGAIVFGGFAMADMGFSGLAIILVLGGALFLLTKLRTGK